jgi:hypothetical protein
MSKGIYHSNLVASGPTFATVTKGPQASKYEGKPDYAVLTFDDGEEKFYSVENPECAAALESVVGQRVTILATGSREAARITVTGGAAAGQAQQAPQQPHQAADTYADQHQPQNQPPQQMQQPAPQNQPPAPAAAPQQGGGIGSALNMDIDARFNQFGFLYNESLLQARIVKHRYHEDVGDVMTPEQFQAAASAIYISAERAELAAQMPSR